MFYNNLSEDGQDTSQYDVIPETKKGAGVGPDVGGQTNLGIYQTMYSPQSNEQSIVEINEQHSGRANLMRRQFHNKYSANVVCSIHDII